MGILPALYFRCSQHLGLDLPSLFLDCHLHGFQQKPRDTVICEQLSLEIRQLLLEQEYVGFELIPLLKDLFKLFPAESTLHSFWRVPWLLLSIHLCKARNVREQSLLALL